MEERKMKRLSGHEYPRAVDWNSVGKLSGVIWDKRGIIFDGIERECLTLKNEDGEFTIWESKGLAPLFELNEGVYVEIKNLGMKKMKSGHEMRVFEIFADENQLKLPF